MSIRARTGMRPVDWFFVTALLLFAACLRLSGIDFGQPDPQYSQSLYPMLPVNAGLHPDEYFYVSIPYEMLARGRKLPHFYENPSFLIDLNYVTFALTGSARDADISRWEGLNNRSYAPFPLYVIGRVYSALGGLITVAAVYATVRLLAGRRGAALAGMLAAVSMPLVQHAHYSTTSSLAAGFAMLCVLACVVCLKRAKLPPLTWLIAGIATGLATGNRYNAAAISIVVFLTGLVALYRGRNVRTLALVAAGYAAFPLTFVLTTPGAVLDFDEFMRQFRFIYGRFASSGGIVNGLFYEYRYMVVFGVGVLALPLIAAGIYAAWRASQRPTGIGVLILLAYLAAYSLVVLNTSAPEIGDQLTLLAVPVLIMLAGIGAGWLMQRWPENRAILPLLTALIMALPALPGIQWLHVLAQPDTRDTMQAWIYANLPRGAHIHLGGGYNVALDDADYVVTQDYVYHTRLADLRNSGVDFLVYSDAAHFTALRDGGTGLIGKGFAEYASLPVLAALDRPALFGDNLMPDNAAYWHNPGFIVYCVRADGCPDITGVQSRRNSV